MDLLKIILIALITVVAIAVLKPINSELSTLLAVGTSILIILVVSDGLFEVVYSFYSLAETTKLNTETFNNLLKIIGVGYLAEFANDICEDSGCKNIGNKIVFAGKISIIVLALPIIKNLVHLIVEILP